MNKAIIIGDATHNTLSAIRSLGEEKIPLCLIMVAEHDSLYVHKSKYLHKRNLYWIKDLNECDAILWQLAETDRGATLMTTFDVAAEWVDARESELSKIFRTPCRGKRLGILFNKDAQCALAKECGLTVPLSLIYYRGDELPSDLLYPLITKPLVSSKGEKSDIHICRFRKELDDALAENSHCNEFVIQEFIDKEFEVDCTGVRTEQEVVMGAIRKYRHWPRLVGAGAFAYFDKVEKYGIDIKGVELFLSKSGYYGPFSVEFLHKDGKNYFMEINFRNEGLAYTATAAGINLHALYMRDHERLKWDKFHPVYMMNTSVDFLYVKEGDITLKQWFRDFRKTTAFINMNKHDIMPTFFYYINKFKRKLSL